MTTSEFQADDIKSPARGRVLLGLLAVGIVAGGLAASGIMARLHDNRAVAAWTEAAAIPTVHLVTPKLGPSTGDLTLPGTVRAFHAASLYARASGYVAAWHKDIGDSVKQGEVLAEISAPDLDQQLAEAKAQLVQLQAAAEQAKATAQLGAVTNERTSRLVAQGWSSLAQGDVDRLTAASRQAAYAVAKANVTAQQAVVDRMLELTRFEKIVAPFDGIVTARNVDTGDLLTANGTSGRALFQLADLHRMRIYVDVPQAFTENMTPGLKATLTLPGRSQTFAATLVSTSNSMAEGTRTTLVELQAENNDRKLWPGAFAEVQFHVGAAAPVLRIPTTALIFGRDGLEVAAVTGQQRVQLRKVELGRDLGGDVEVVRGITAADRLVDNPQETIADGDHVEVAQPSIAPSGGQGEVARK